MRMRILLIISALVLAGCQTTTPAPASELVVQAPIAQPQEMQETPSVVVCGERTKLLEQLEIKYKETPISMGLAANGSVVEVTRSDKGTWTLLLTSPTGLTCLMAAGEHWEVLKGKKPKTSPGKKL